MTFCSCSVVNDMRPMANDIELVTTFLINENGLIITLLTDNEDNKTYSFNQYNFTFNSDGSVLAADANKSVNGTHFVFRDDGRTELRMNFPNSQNFDELNYDWHFVSIDQNTIRFDDAGYLLEFQKNNQ